MSKFKDAVIKVVRLIPKGKVVSYGQVALYVGLPRGARQVGWILNGLGEEIPIPWWRVVNNKGKITIKGSTYSAIEQKALLTKEGIGVDADFNLDIDKYRFVPDINFIRDLKLDPIYLNQVLDKIPMSKPFFE